MERDVLAQLDGGFTVVRAERGDLPALINLLLDDPLGRDREDAGDPAYARAFAQIDADPNQLLVSVLSPAGDVVATLQLTVIPGLSRRGATRAQLEGVRVAAAHRSTGLGTALIRWSVEHAQAQGAQVMQLTTDLSRERAHEFYRRLGFTGSHLGMKLPLT